MDPTIGRFLLFLLGEVLAVVVWIVALRAMAQVTVRTSFKSHYFITSVLLLVPIHYGILFGFVWILTDTYYLNLFATLALVSMVLIAGIELIGPAVGNRNAWWVSRSIYMREEFRHIYPKTTKYLDVALIVALLIYPVFVGYGYFGARYAQPGWELYVFQATIILFILFKLHALPGSIYVMSSCDILEGTRSPILMTLLGGAIPLFLSVSLLLWSMRYEGDSIALLGDQFVFSPVLVAVITVYVLFFLITPYLIGHRNSKKWFGSLKEDRIELLNSLSMSLLVPNANVNQDLDEAYEMVLNQKNEIASEEVMQFAKEVESSDQSGMALSRAAFENFKKWDPKLARIKILNDLCHLIKTCKETINKQASEPEKIRIVERYANVFKTQAELVRQEPDPANPWIIVLITLIVSQIFVPIFNWIGKYVIKSIGLDVAG